MDPKPKPEPFDDNSIEHNYTAEVPLYHIGIQEQLCPKCKGRGAVLIAGSDFAEEGCPICWGHGSI